MLKFMYITNDPKIAALAESAGVDRIFIDLETVGKQLRQTIPWPTSGPSVPP